MFINKYRLKEIENRLYELEKGPMIDYIPKYQDWGPSIKNVPLKEVVLLIIEYLKLELKYTGKTTAYTSLIKKTKKK